MYYQQGDVLLKKVGSLPEGSKPVNGKVLQLGEATGHKHEFAESDDVTIYVDPDFQGSDTRITPDEGKFIIVGTTPVMLIHPEHKPIEVEPGTYKVDIVREFDYDAKEAKRVLD